MGWREDRDRRRASQGRGQRNPRPLFESSRPERNDASDWDSADFNHDHDASGDVDDDREEFV